MPSSHLLWFRYLLPTCLIWDSLAAAGVRLVAQRPRCSQRDTKRRKDDGDDDDDENGDMIHLVTFYNILLSSHLVLLTRLVLIIILTLYISCLLFATGIKSAWDGMLFFLNSLFSFSIIWNLYEFLAFTSHTSSLWLLYTYKWAQTVHTLVNVRCAHICAYINNSTNWNWKKEKKEKNRYASLVYLR